MSNNNHSIELQPTSHLLTIPANLSPAQREQVQGHLNGLRELVGQNLIRLSHPLDVSSRREAILSQPLGEDARQWGIHSLRDALVMGGDYIFELLLAKTVNRLFRSAKAENLEVVRNPGPGDHAQICRSINQVSHLALSLTMEECVAVHDHFYPGQDLGEGDLYLSVGDVLTYQEAVGATSEANDAIDGIARKAGSYVQQFAAALAMQHYLEG